MTTPMINLRILWECPSLESHYTPHPSRLACHLAVRHCRRPRGHWLEAW
eukprot:COSAG04_NODE_161_length_22014_cov_18.687383_14_plen_49_part_00